MVVSGVEEDNVILGDIWYVVDDFRGNALEGRAIVYDDSTPLELLPEYYGEKHVSEGGILGVMHTSYDGCADKILSPDSSFYTEEKFNWTGRSMKPYNFTVTSSIYGELSVIELPAEIMSEQSIEAKVYGNSLLQQVNEAYPEGERQYIKRKNGDLKLFMLMIRKELLKGIFRKF